MTTKGLLKWGTTCSETSTKVTSKNIDNKWNNDWGIELNIIDDEIRNNRETHN